MYCKNTNVFYSYLANIFHSLVGIIPQTWRRYTVPQGITVIQWITDFSGRVKQLQKIVQATTQGGAKELKV